MTNSQAEDYVRQFYRAYKRAGFDDSMMTIPGEYHIAREQLGEERCSEIEAEVNASN